MLLAFGRPSVRRRRRIEIRILTTKYYPLERKAAGWEIVSPIFRLFHRLRAWREKKILLHACIPYILACMQYTHMYEYTLTYIHGTYIHSHTHVHLLASQSGVAWEGASTNYYYLALYYYTLLYSFAISSRSMQQPTTTTTTSSTTSTSTSTSTTTYTAGLFLLCSSLSASVFWHVTCFLAVLTARLYLSFLAIELTD